MITAQMKLKTTYGEFSLAYHKHDDVENLSISYGEIRNDRPLVRIHSSCLFGEVLGSFHCDCKQQINEALERISKYGNGVVIYSFEEGRGAGLENKIKAMSLQSEKGYDTVEAFNELGLEVDSRDFKAAVASLKDLETNKNIVVLGGNTQKYSALENGGFTILEMISTTFENLHPEAINERSTKKNKLGYNYLD